MSDRLLELSTQIKPPAVFAVDGDEYRLLGFEHLGKSDEARATALFAKYGRLTRLIAREKSQPRAEKIAGAMYDVRMELMCTLTDLPREVAERLPMSQQTKLLTAIRQEIGEEDEDDLDGEGEQDSPGEDI